MVKREIRLLGGSFLVTAMTGTNLKSKRTAIEKVPAVADDNTPTVKLVGD